MTGSAVHRSPPQSTAVATPCDAEPSQGDFRSRIGGGTGEPTAEATYARFGGSFPQSILRSDSAVSAEPHDLSTLKAVFGQGVKLHPEGGKLDRWLEQYEADNAAWWARQRGGV